MDALVGLLDAAGVLLALVLLYGVALVARRRLLARDGGTFELSVHVAARPHGRGWALGLGRYRGQELQWFRIFTLSPRPKLVWQRRDLDYVAQRAPDRSEAAALYVDHVIVECRSGAETIELAMSPSALTGLQSWLEAGPPGDRAGQGG